jgi:hypothetical protein
LSPNTATSGALLKSAPALQYDAISAQVEIEDMSKVSKNNSISLSLSQQFPLHETSVVVCPFVFAAAAAVEVSVFVSVLVRVVCVAVVSVTVTVVEGVAVETCSVVGASSVVTLSLSLSLSTQVPHVTGHISRSEPAAGVSKAAIPSHTARVMPEQPAASDFPLHTLWFFVERGFVVVGCSVVAASGQLPHLIGQKIRMLAPTVVSLHVVTAKALQTDRSADPSLQVEASAGTASVVVTKMQLLQSTGQTAATSKRENEFESQNLPRPAVAHAVGSTDPLHLASVVVVTVDAVPVVSVVTVALVNDVRVAVTLVTVAVDVVAVTAVAVNPVVVVPVFVVRVAVALVDVALVAVTEVTVAVVFVVVVSVSVNDVAVRVVSVLEVIVDVEVHDRHRLGHAFWANGPANVSTQSFMDSKLHA